MCAINPKHKKRLILDVYTSDKEISLEEFEALVIKRILELEIDLNQNHRFRWHIKETSQEAE